MTRRIKAKAIKKKDLSSEEMALVFLLLAKASVQEKREREAQEQAERREVRRAS